MTEAELKRLDDLALFAAVVDHGGFSGASRSLGIPKSRISRRVSGLEDELGVRLLQRSTRVIHVTDVGAQFYLHCEAMAKSARAAFEVAQQAAVRPSGRLRVSCPIGVAHIFLAPVLAKFLTAHPDVRLALDLTNRRVDVIGEGYDVALRIRTTLDDSDLVVRSLGVSAQVLAASRPFVEKHGPFSSAKSLEGVLGIGPGEGAGGRPSWRLTAPDGTSRDIGYAAAMVTDDVFVATEMALAGVGAAQLPIGLCGQAIADGRLVSLLPDHVVAPHRLHAVFPSRRGLVPAVRAFVDFLAAEIPTMAGELRRVG